MKTIFTINRALDFSLNQSNLQFFSSQSLNAFAGLNIEWFALDSNGFIKNFNKFVQNKAAIYIDHPVLQGGEVYIGSASNLLQRFSQHRGRANRGDSTCPKFYNAIRKGGKHIKDV